MGKNGNASPGGTQSADLLQLEEEDPAFATLSSPTDGKGGAASEEGGKPPPDDRAEEASQSKLEKLKAEDPAFATLRSEDATAEGTRSPPQEAVVSNEEATAGGDDLAKELERLELGKDSKQAAEPEAPSKSRDLNRIADVIKKGGAKKVIFMTGAGISVSAGIPDFRTPGTGLYDNLQKFNLPYPEAVFSLDYFCSKPEPFYQLAKELFPGSFKPTPAHHFMVLMHKKGLLLRCFTQNIDSLESQAGLPAEKVVAAHGNFDTAHCISCHKEVPQQTVKAAVDMAKPCRCTKCKGLVKPDIVFFGEALPETFFKRLKQDFPAADLLVVMGSSLVVQPFASLIDYVGDGVPRLLINRERVAEGHGLMGGFNFDSGQRDCLFLGDCDAGVRELASLLGWREELEAMITGARSVASPI